MCLHLVQLKIMAVGTVCRGVVDLCAFLALESTILIGCGVFLAVVCKSRINFEHYIQGLHSLCNKNNFAIKTKSVECSLYNMEPFGPLVRTPYKERSTLKASC